MSFYDPSNLILWMLLSLGTLCSGASLYRCYLRCAHWHRLRQWHRGAIVPADDVLQIGQQITLFPQFSQDIEAPEPLSGRIAWIDRGTLAVRALNSARIASSSSREEMDLKRGATVLACIATETGQYRFTATVQDVRAQPAGTATSEVCLSRPFWMARVQRRQHPRIRWSMPVTLQPIRAIARPCHRYPGDARSLDVCIAPPRHAVLVDLSAGGLCADLDTSGGAAEAATLVQCYAPDTILKVRLPLALPSGHPLLARVLTVRRIARRGGLGVRVTCEFLSTPSADQEALIAHLFSAQREQLAAYCSGA
ncbi:MAG: PilZ domain-containing protein [Chloroherpetonaceae bacterium]|nr:PilZ domain-containing protein [Chthonomonadaceae bacterium]MDW8207267.1 PilZ domain-containing protein [Chloroherpetonaceae bacterium]